jgi:hypothetical protein
MLTVLALLVAVVALVAAFLALRTLARLRHSVGLLGRGPDGGRESVVETTVRYLARADQTQREFDDMTLRVLAALHTYEESARATVERAADRESVTAQISDVRAELAAQLEQLKSIVNAELVEIRAGVDEQRAAAIDDVTAERNRAAADEAAVKEQLIRSAQRVDQVIENVIDTAVRRLALVRFDAFDDLSGRLSFSLALLDGRGDGVALTSLAGHSDTRLYAKPIKTGKSAVDLSPEEAQAVAAAMCK